MHFVETVQFIDNIYALYNTTFYLIINAFLTFNTDKIKYV